MRDLDYERQMDAIYTATEQVPVSYNGELYVTPKPSPTKYPEGLTALDIAIELVNRGIK